MSRQNLNRNRPRYASRLLPAAMLLTSLLIGVCAEAVWAATVEATSADRPASADRPVDVMDWPNWLGPAQDRSSVEKGLIDKWDPAGSEGSQLVWKRSDLGTISTPIVLGDKLYVLARDQPGTPTEGEKVVCVDAATGEDLWQHRFNVSLSDVPDTRVAWSSVVADPETGRIYAQGVSGYFCCLEGATGHVVWERSLHQEFGVITTYGGRTNVPVVFEDLVLISAVIVGWGDTPQFGALAKPAHRFLAMDKATGELRWLNGTSISPYDTTYSTPTVAEIDGEAQLIFGSGDGGVWSFQPRTGKRLWNYPFSRRGLNVSPLVHGNRVYMSHSEENLVGNTMGAVVALDATGRGDLTGKAIWQQYQIMAGKSSPLLVGDQLWIVDDRAKLHLLDSQTGKRLSKKSLGTVMRSTPLYADGKVYLCTNSGRWYILKPTSRGASIIHRLRLEESCSGSPIVSHGYLYLPTTEALYCLGAGSRRETSAARSAALSSASRAAGTVADSQLAQLQIAPCDVLLRPGESVQFVARGYNARGELLAALSPAQLTYRVVGPGSVSATGQYQASATSDHTAAVVVAKVEGVEATARIRIVPPLPWFWDFDQDDDLPITWIGGRVRYVLQEVDGQRVATKRSVLPTPSDPNNKLGTRSQAFMGPVGLTNYTIEADVRLTEHNGRLPDVGLINSGYSLMLRSQNGELRATSWSPHDYRTYAATQVAPEVGVWYRLKLRVEQQGETAQVRGKMWPRDEAEPGDWSVEMVDHAPNRTGSPGLYGNSQEAEFHVDNVSVVPNS
jgi:outer membrane protein assembly factor BamB